MILQAGGAEKRPLFFIRVKILPYNERNKY